ncbi:MAG TPA: macro domain-containing protein [Aggregatilineales bacterium]|nr:macro domain-containing protein [Aggregatilineales bacterium]
METLINGRTLALVEGDITEQDTDAIVNAANEHLQLGGGVAGAIRRKGGSAIQAECDEIGYCPVGQAVSTTGGNLKARYVIHAVGPRGGEPQADVKLASAVRSALGEADRLGLRSIALPAISTGIFGYPMEEAAGIMLAAALAYLQQEETGLERVVFCLYGEEAYNIFATELARLLDELSKIEK